MICAVIISDIWSICEIFTFPLTQILNRGQNLPSFPTFTPLYHQKKKSAVNIRKYVSRHPLNHTHGAATALELRVCTNPAGISRRSPVCEVLYPSLREHIGPFGSTAATKTREPAAMLGLFHFSDLEKNAVLEERSGWRTPLNVLAAPRGLVLVFIVDLSRGQGARVVSALQRRQHCLRGIGQYVHNIGFILEKKCCGSNRSGAHILAVSKIHSKLNSRGKGCLILFAKEGSKVAKKTFFDHQKRD